MLDNSNILGNGSSIFKTVGLLIAGYIIPIFVSNGVNLNGQETQITQLLGLIIASALSYVDMKYANSFFKRNITIDEYIAYGEKHFGMQTVTEEIPIPGIDPVSEYDDGEDNGA